MVWIIAQERECVIGAQLHSRRQPVVELSKPPSLVVLQSHRRVPESFSSRASRTRKSRLPAAESASICRSQSAQSRSRNHFRKRSYLRPDRPSTADSSSRNVLMGKVYLRWPGSQAALIALRFSPGVMRIASWSSVPPSGVMRNARSVQHHCPRALRVNNYVLCPPNYPVRRPRDSTSQGHRSPRSHQETGDCPLTGQERFQAWNLGLNWSLGLGPWDFASRRRAVPGSPYRVPRLSKARSALSVHRSAWS